MREFCIVIDQDNEQEMVYKPTQYSLYLKWWLECILVLNGRLIERIIE